LKRSQQISKGGEPKQDCGKWELPTQQKQRHPEQDRINNVHSSLPSIPGAIKYLHALQPVSQLNRHGSWLSKQEILLCGRGITVKSVSKPFPESNETLKGHMKLQRMNVRSTKKIEANEDIKENMPTLTNQKKGDVFISVFNTHNTVYTDQTGSFPVTSSRGNKYVMVMCEVDGNYIDAELMKSRTTDSLVKTYLTVWKRLTSSKVITPKLHILDNECPAELNEVIKNDCKLQLVPPDTHHSNLAERAIQTFKSHFISILSGVDKIFPLHLWDRLVPQAILTLNLLRQSNVAPTVSAYQYICEWPIQLQCYATRTNGQWVVQCRFSTAPTKEKVGRRGHWMDGICKHHRNTIIAIESMSRKQRTRECRIQSLSSTGISHN
jgi:hypothetical protein